ncbi:hypothetical protein [Leptospira borgpetersenii]|uniref:hypothetical protein n=1 Tax=Leptospira borgpetersenii TaxID=174 RepID=UPI0013A674C2|nr:hypothetical protein [Leptospira borgpetersenii]
MGRHIRACPAPQLDLSDKAKNCKPFAPIAHKYLDLKINLSELLQILCETYAPP